MESFQMGLPVLATLIAYLLGSMSFAVIVSRAMGLRDPRTFGSKNPGATNVLRSGSKAAAAVTLLLDAAKGWLPVWAVLAWGPAYGLHEGAAALVGLAAFLGHVYPVFFRFEGGKGVATALGVLLGVNGWLGLGVLGVWVAVALGLRYSSLASMVSAVSAPVIYILLDGVLWRLHASLALSVAVMALFLLYRHAENIGRLIKGTESRLGKKADARTGQVAPAVAKPHHGHPYSSKKPHA